MLGRVWPLAALVTACLYAQSTTGTIQGSVRDASGAVIPEATLTLRNLDENTSRSLHSDSFGLYAFLDLQPGRYQLTAERSGFSTSTAPEIPLPARETRRADFTLQVASVAEGTIVTARVPLIETESSAIVDSKNVEQVTQLPMNLRARTSSPFAAILAMSGVQQDSGGGVSIGGGLPAQIEYSVDGISTLGIDSHLNYGAVSPSPEMLQEFRVTSSGAGAAFGPMADVTVVSRGGTNQLHGSALWYAQNRALDAITYGAPRKQEKILNTAGASLGGPVWIPSIYQGRNRTFFFADFEFNRHPGTTLIQKLYPPVAARQGNLNGVPGGPAMDPLTGAPFPGNLIPQSRINPVASTLLNHYYPLPKAASANGTYNFLDLESNASSINQYDLRLDHVIGSTQRLFVRWSWKDADALQPNLAPLPASEAQSDYESLVFGHTLALSSGLLNEIRIGFALAASRGHFPIRGRDAVADLGLVGLNLTGAGDSGGFPYFDFSQGTGYAYTYEGRSGLDVSRNYQFTDTLSLVRGRHTARFGADVRRISYQSVLHDGGGADDFGGFYFDGSFSGNAFADFLLGIPIQTYYAALGPNISENSTHESSFAQDSWRISSRLNLEAGLRWELHMPLVETSGNITNFDHSNGNVIIPDHTIPPAPGFLTAINACPSAGTMPAGCTRILTASQAGLPEGLRATYYRDWNPRLGLAWQPWGDGKTVVRGGIGIYTLAPLGQVAYALTGIHSSGVRTIDNYLTPGGQPLFALPNILPQPDALGEVSREDFISGADPKLRDPRSYQWNFTLERELPWFTTFRASYIGVQSTGMEEDVDLNQLPASLQPFSFNRAPFQNWGYLGSVENIGFANYQGLQVEGARRMRGGMYFQATYTHSKNLGSVGSAKLTNFPTEISNAVTDRFDTRYDRGNLAGARRDRFLLTAIVPLPLGKNRRFGANWHGVLQGTLGGWHLSTISLLETGPFLTPTISSGLDQSNTDVGERASARPDRIGNGNVPDPTPNNYFDKSALVAVPSGAGRFGNSGAGILVGPGTVALAAGLAKTFNLSERFRLRLEGTFTNFPNHPNFASPVTNISSPLFGKLTTVQSAENSGNRIGQVGARLDF